MYNHNFKAQYKNEAGEWTSMHSVFPFSYGKFLDEQLYEAYLHMWQDPNSIYNPGTEMCITWTEGEETPMYYVVARDSAMECPIGSGTYKHDIYLIERTKLLEGLIGQTITFTNAKGNLYTQNQSPVIAVFNSAFSVDNYTNSQIVSPLSTEETYSFPSIQTVGEQIANQYIQTHPTYTFIVVEPTDPSVSSPDAGSYSSITINNGGQTQTYSAQNMSLDEWNTFKNQTFTITPANPIVLTYNIVIHYVVLGSDTYITFNLSFNILATTNKYPLKRWSITDCVNRVLMLAEPLYGTQAPRYTFDTTQAQQYAAVWAPEFTMTQCSLREQLRIIGGYIHAEPRLTENDTIVFDPYNVQQNTSNPVSVYNGLSRSINEYCKEIRTGAKNIVNRLDYAQGVVVAPNSMNYRTVRTDTVNIRVEEGNAFAETVKPIYEIPQAAGSVMCGIFLAGGSGGTTWAAEPVDITPYIFEKKEYDANLSSYDGGYPNAKSFALWYERGTNNLNGLYFKNENAVSPYFSNYAIVNILQVCGIENAKDLIQQNNAMLAFRITYVPIYDVQISHSKPSWETGGFPFAQIYNQSENLIETRYYGENIKGAAARLGNVEQERTYRLPSLSMVPTIGQMIDGYYVSAVNVEVLFRNIKCTVALSKDFNRLSQYVGISSNKRVYEVSESQAYNRDILLKEYITVGTQSTLAPGIFRDMYSMSYTFDRDETEGNRVITACSSQSLYSSGTPIASVLLPVTSSAFGNVMTFSWNYKDNYSAGVAVEAQTNDDVTGYFTKDVAYSDYYGRISGYDFTLLAPVQGENQNDLPDLGVSFALGGPSSDYITPSGSYGISTSFYSPYQMKKDNRESISITYALEFYSNLQGLYVGSGLAASCSLVGSYTNTPAIALLASPINPLEHYINDSMIQQSSVQEFTQQGIYSVDSPTLLMISHRYFQNASGFVIYTPITTVTRTVQDDEGNISTETTQEGGEILLFSNSALPTQNIYLQSVHSIYD